MRFAREIIAEAAANHQEDMDCDQLADEVIAALAAEGYQISAAQAPATGGGPKVAVSPPKLDSAPKFQGQV